MSDKRRPIIGVVAAEVNCIEQRQILKGIVEEAQGANADTAVISNIFNANTPEDYNFCENEIYRLLLSPDLDGLIFISESFVNDRLKELIRQLLSKRNDLPMIAVGTKLSELDELGLRYINTNGEHDIEELTDHLIDEHGFTDIHILTGYAHIEASQLRVSGYRKSLEKHGIPFDEEKVHIGNFWMTSGEELAMKLINGDIPMPQAIVCANDYMAYGILDTLMAHGIPVPEAVTVVGYEYIWERIYHSPLLTTYQRNRADLGRSAVRILLAQIEGRPTYPFKPPKGKLIHGDSCPCKRHSEEYVGELKTALNANMYSEWNINSPMDRQLTNCSRVDEIAEVMGKNSFLVRYIQNMYLCLLEKWYDDSPAEQDIISCRSVLPWLDNTVSLIHKHNFARIFAENDQPGVYYFSPLFFGTKTFGYTVLMYDNPDTYDVIYKNWVKSICNALEFIRMKNDIRYFTAYDELDQQYDTLTGIYNEKGFAKAVQYAAGNCPEGDISLILVDLNTSDESLDRLGTLLDLTKEVSDCLRMLSSKKGDILGRLDRSLFAFAAVGDLAEGLTDLLADKLRLLMTYRSSAVRQWGLDSFTITGKQLKAAELDWRSVIGELREDIERQERSAAEKSLLSGFGKFLSCRRALCMEPWEEHQIGRICQDFGLSEGHFRKLYKDYFDVSFHSDLLGFRIDYAKYLLCTTPLDTNTVSTKCGYIDTKYFLRIFRKCTSYTAKQYRDLFK